MNFFTRLSKRLFDILFSIFIIIFLSPLFLLIALSIKLSSKGPILYKSIRVKKDLQLFTFFKFRTMYVDADQKLKDLISKDPVAKAQWKQHVKLKNDPRITSIGKFLRKTSLDELPQFFNVLKGDLSVVGPRPFAIMGDIKHYEAEIQGYLGIDTRKILSIQPGITGLWQISGRSELSLSERIKLDKLYVEKRSFLFDLYLIVKTIPAVVLAKGAY